MDFATYFPIWDKLTPAQQKKIEDATYFREVPKGMVLHSGETNCLGIVLIESGQLRAYSISSEGREVTLYRLFEMDTCIFTASCAMPNIMFDMVIEAEKDSEVMVIPPDVYNAVLMESAPLANYHNQVISSRFSDVMWVMQQILFMSMDKRLAIFLLDESARLGADTINLTHEQIAKYIGSAREVVSRVLKYFASEGLVEVSRKGVRLLDKQALRALTL